ncbi:MAG: chloride channel protein [Pseudomonadota bacterium]
MVNLVRRTVAMVTSWIEPNLRLFLSTRQFQLWSLAVLVGFGVALMAVAFREAIGLVQLAWLGTRSEQVATAAADLPWWVILIAPALGGLVVGIILQRLMGGRRAGGVADVMEAKTFGGRTLDLKHGFYSAVVTTISLGSGASAGREGPIVHLGGTIGAAISGYLRLPDNARRVLLACGVAAAISTSFNAPLAGVLFAHEVILGHYAFSAFVPIVIASAAGAVVSRLYFGDAAAFVIPDYQVTSFWEFPAFAILGITCAVVAIIFQFALIGTDWVARHVTIPLWMRPVIGGLMVGAIGVFFPEILGVGYEATDLALRQELPITLMLMLLVAKTAATAITLASRFGGGIVAPAFFLGAMTGGAYGLIAASAFPDLASSHGLYAILGMGAVGAAILGAPLSTTMIVFELTGGYGISIALLLSAAIATGLHQAVHGRSFFHWQLETRGLILQEGPHAWLVKRVTVRDFMVRNPPDSAPEVYDPDTDGPSLTPGDSLETALRVFDDSGKTTLPVVDPHQPTAVVGSAAHLKALNYFNSALIEQSVEEHR